MKASITTTALIWLCNLTIIITALFVAHNIYRSTQGFNPFDMDSDEMKSVSSITTASPTIFGSSYYYHSVYDSENDSRTEYFYFVPGNMEYKFDIVSAPRVTAQLLDEELSKTDWLGNRRFSVFADSAEVPLILAKPGFEIEDGETLNRMFRIGSISIIGYLIYIIVLIWFIRRFVLGLKTNSFFTQKNVFNLKITSLMVLVAPFLDYLWFLIIEQLPETLLSIEGASLYGSAGYTFKIEMLLAGLILIVISTAFEHAVKLQKEQELTI